MAPALPPSADYVIVGGGTSGLVLASRLSEDPNASIVVVESGPDQTTNPEVRDPLVWRALSGSALDWKPRTIPQEGLNNRTLDHPAGRVLGGSSTINGLVLTPPSPAGMDAWAKLGNPDWTWEAFKPYLQKSCTFPGKAAEGVIKTMDPTLVDGVNNTLAQAWIDAHAGEGYEQATDFEGEQQTIGVRPFTATIDPVTGTRSSADNTYGAVAGARSNVTIVTEATVRRILFSESGGITASGVEVDCKGSTVTVGALKEVILAAGAFHTPKLLELSGVGDKERLRSLGIPVVLHSPGVGESFQNHTMGIIPVPLKDNPDLANVKPGIQALAFRQLDPDDIAEVLNQKQEWNGHEDVIKTLLHSPKEASAYSLIGMMQNLAIVVVMLTFPFSRGSVHISSADPDAPTRIDPRLLSSDLDIEFLARHVRDLRRLLSSPAFEPLIQSPREPAELAKLKTTLRESMASTAHHACGTAAMLPKECGGVVDQDLKVYGTTNMRIVDASVFPLIPHANPMATVYGVAERASDLIKGCCR